MARDIYFGPHSKYRVRQKPITQHRSILKLSNTFQVSYLSLNYDSNLIAINWEPK